MIRLFTGYRGLGKWGVALFRVSDSHNVLFTQFVVQFSVYFSALFYTSQKNKCLNQLCSAFSISISLHFFLSIQLQTVHLSPRNSSFQILKDLNIPKPVVSFPFLF
jgi:hypothetical protein|uniref:Uncharacterized protein n=1 Tax=Mus musculus TaxID=10090 RepID=Q9D4U9_MOUSE|nr:unnamed protein product [Mus musculus]